MTGSSDAGANKQSALALGSLGFLVVVTLFFVSGMTSLVYQVIWTRFLVFVFGATSFATSTVLAVFMGGIALGSFFAGRHADKIKRPFLMYGILEGIIGIWALLVPLLFSAAVPLYKMIWQSMHMSMLPFSLLRFLVAVAILLIPTTCMGATLPLLARFVTTSLSLVGNRIGTLYSVNTLGAVVGSVCAGFVFLPNLGLSTTTTIAAIGNILLCAIAIIFSRKHESGQSPERTQVEETSSQAVLPASDSDKSILTYVLIAFGASGAAAMIYEVAWTRTLLMVIGSTTYAFTTMLSTFLVGIAIGSFVCSKYADRIKQPLVAFSVVQFLLAFSGFLSIALFNLVPYWNLLINMQLGNTPQSAMVVRFLLSALLLMPITLCLGAVFPIVVTACTRELRAVGKSVGDLYAANTFGAIIGAFLAGFAIIPLIGAERTLVVGACMNLVIGLALMLRAPSAPKQLKLAAAAMCIVIVSFKIAQPDSWNHTVLMSAQGQRRTLWTADMNHLKSFASFKQELDKTRQTMFYKDGPCSSVGVMEFRGAHPYHALYTNGHVDASDNVDMANQGRLAVYPMLVHGAAKKVAVVGWGSGVTVGAAAQFPCESVTAIELEPAVMEAAKYFSHVNFHPEQDPKVKTEVNDGRNYLLATNEKFDVIISEPSNPWQSGVCNLFTKEYFEVCKQRLNQNGIFSLWLQIAEIAPDNVKSILASLRSVYKNALMMKSPNGNVIVLASDGPLKLNYERLKQDFDSKKYDRVFKLSGFSSPEDVLTQVLLSTQDLETLTSNVPPNLDDRNRLEFAVAMTYENKSFTSDNSETLERSTTAPEASIDWGQTSAEQKASVMQKVAEACLQEAQPELAQKWSEQLLAVHPSSEAYCLLASAMIDRHVDRRQAMDVLEKAKLLEPQNPHPLFIKANLLLKQDGDYEAARTQYANILRNYKNAKDSSTARVRIAETYMPSVRNLLRRKPVKSLPDQPSEALAILAPLVNDDNEISKHPEILRLQGMALYESRKDFAAAEKLFSRYLQADPANIAAREELASIYEKEGQSGKAAQMKVISTRARQLLIHDLLRDAKRALSERQEDQAVTALGNVLKVDHANPEALRLLTQMSEGNAQARQLL